jgi:hypothetical protein
MHVWAAAKFATEEISAAARRVPYAMLCECARTNA